MISLGHSDHRLVQCKLEFYKFKRGNGIYKLNSSLFENSIFRESMGKMIKKNIEELEDIDPIIRWNTLKVRIKEFAQQFGKFNKTSKENKVTILKNRLQSLENELIQDISNVEKQTEVLDCKTKLEIINIF